jgi:enoyl-[acyl-carrier protein] reductase I
MGIFSGKKGLVLGVANDYSIAWAISQKLIEEGADVGFTHLPGDKMERRVRKLTDPAGAKLLVPCDVQKDEDVAAAFDKAAETFGPLDFVLHSIAFAPIPVRGCKPGRVQGRDGYQRLLAGRRCEERRASHAGGGLHPHIDLLRRRARGPGL